MRLLVVATLPKAPVPWHLGSAPTSSLCKRLAERMDLETCGHAPTRISMCLLHGPDKGADVVVSRPVPSLGTSFPLTSVQFFMVLDNVKVPVLVAARTRGAPSLLAVTWPHVPSKASWLTVNKACLHKRACYWPATVSSSSNSGATFAPAPVGLDG